MPDPCLFTSTPFPSTTLVLKYTCYDKNVLAILTLYIRYKCQPLALTLTLATIICVATKSIYIKEVEPTSLYNSPLFKNFWASLVVQWLRICLPMQGTWVRALVWEDPTCRGATKPVCHNY